MNERIKELILAAGFPKFDKMYVVSDGEELEKFAELIVRECVEVVKWTPSQFPNDEYVKNIKEHFGVEE